MDLLFLYGQWEGRLPTIPLPYLQLLCESAARAVCSGVPSQLLCIPHTLVSGKHKPREMAEPW